MVRVALRLSREDLMRLTIALGAIGLVCALIGSAAAPSPARANCYEIIGCSDSQYFKLSDLKQLPIAVGIPQLDLQGERLLLQDAEDDRGVRQCRLSL
jgi:hypothetical protein